ncbi:MAG: PKD domain-containing protein [Caldisericia bacterium]
MQLASRLNIFDPIYHHLEEEPTPITSPTYPSDSYRRPFKWLYLWYENLYTDIDEITFTLRVEYTVPFSDSYITNNYGDNNFDPMATPKYYYTHMMTSASFIPPYPNTFEDEQFHNFVGFNTPYSYNNLIVTPEFHYLNACGPDRFFNIILRSPWGDNVDFHYELSVDNWDQLIGIKTWFRNESGDSRNGVAVTGLNVLAACLAPATWFTPRIKAEFSREDDPDNIKYSTKEVKLLVRKPHLYGDKTANTSMATVGDVVFYTITVGNKGSGSAYDVEVVDIMPHDLEYLYSSIAGNKNGNNISFLFEEIGPGEEYKIKIACRIRTDAHIKSGDVITNTARISGLEKDLSTNMGITIRGTVPGCEMPQVEMIIDKHKRGESIRAGEEFDCKMLIHRGCNPFDVVIFWDDNGNSDRFEIGQSMEHDFTHTYDEPGEYLVRVSVADEYGKMVNLYKHIYVKNK